ncbi:MAG: hypothetical protein ACOY46_11925 [Bacillota bacterium]
MSWRINPLDLVNKKEAEIRVARLMQDHPGLSKRELCDIIIARKSFWCAGSGAFTALPGIIPGFGSLITLIGGTAIDIMALMYFMAEMITEIAIVYDRDLRSRGAARETAWVYLYSIGADTVGKNISKAAVSQMGKQAFIKVAQDIMVTMGIRVSQRTILKVIPVAGALISGTVNLFFCRRAGKTVADYYERSRPDDWEGVTIDI